MSEPKKQVCRCRPAIPSDEGREGRRFGPCFHCGVRLVFTGKTIERAEGGARLVCPECSKRPEYLLSYLLYETRRLHEEMARRDAPLLDLEAKLSDELWATTEPGEIQSIALRLFTAELAAPDLTAERKVELLASVEEINEYDDAALLGYRSRLLAGKEAHLGWVPPDKRM